MIRIGLTGSIAMGKSAVARIMREAGYPVFDADAEVHMLYESPEGAALLAPHVPEAMAHGRVDRAALSKAVVADPSLLSRIEPLVHAEIARRRTAFLSAEEEKGSAMAIVDVPLLFEKQGEKDVDVTIVVSAPPNLQRQRALARPGMTEAKLAMILSRQMPDAEKRKRANHVIENDGDLAMLQSRTLHVLSAIKREHSL